MQFTSRGRALSRHGMVGICAAAIAALATTALTAGAVHAAGELNALVWCDHTDPALIKPFEDKYGVKVNLKE